MATYQIVSSAGDYHLVVVEFSGHSFAQNITTKLKGEALESFVQSYADEYEADYVEVASVIDGA